MDARGSSLSIIQLDKVLVLREAPSLNHKLSPTDKYSQIVILDHAESYLKGIVNCSPTEENN